MKTITSAALVLMFLLCSCRESQQGIPNNSGAVNQDDRTHAPGKNFDGSQEALIPGSRH
jgi:hypothetical protein